MQEDLNKHKTNKYFRLQHFLFETRHGKLELATLHEI
jgi:hypothetical protein